MKSNRPLAVLLISCLYVLTGIGGLAFHLSQYKLQHPFEYDIVMIAIVEILAIIAGAYMLRGNNWARWLAIAWMAFHVIISVRGPLPPLVVHCLLFLIFVYFLFNRSANKYFASQALANPPQ